MTLQQVIAAPSPQFHARDMERDHPAAILNTSGTMGKQKGATFSHGNVISNTLAATHVDGKSSEDWGCSSRHFPPLFHVFGQNAIMNTAVAARATSSANGASIPSRRPRASSASG
jgi:acyl-CoA synthetase (AMP-forming)/AMP-acid ligase II